MLRSTWSTLSRGITRGQHVQRTVRNMNLNAITRFLHTTPVVDRENESDAFVPLSPEDVARFHRDGYLVVKNALDDAQVDAIEAVYDEFMSQQRSVPGRDYGDHSQGHGVKKEDMVMINVNQPTLHHPDWRNNVFERFCRHVVKQLYPELPMVKDYDQLLTKLPNKPRAQFPVHQDMAYWPKKSNAPTDTATFSLAVSDATLPHGCLYVVPGSHKHENVAAHKDDINQCRDNTGDGRALQMDLHSADLDIVYLPVKRGDVTIHDEWIVHGSRGNAADTPRKTYVMAFRHKDAVEYSRRIGFNHSYNDDPRVLSAIRQGRL